MTTGPTNAPQTKVYAAAELPDYAVHSPAQQRRYLIVLALVMLLLIAVYPVVKASLHQGSADGHSANEAVGALLGLVAGLAWIVHFYTLGNRFHLFIGLAFFVNAAEDLVHGLLSSNDLQRLVGLPASSLRQFVPGTYVVGRLALGVVLILALFVARRLGESKHPKRETLWVSSAVLAGTMLVTAVVFQLPLPTFIYPERLVSRPVDLLSAVVLLVALVAFFLEYHRVRDMLTWWVLLSIAVNTVGQVLMSFSKSLYDPFFDIAHLYKVFGYLIPLLGFTLYQIAIITQRVVAEERYRRLFEEAPVMYVVIRDREGVPFIADCNQAFTGAVGYARDEVLGRPLADFYTPQSLAEMRKGGYRQALAGMSVAQERQLLARDGRVVETLLRAVPERGAEGRVIGTRAMYVDVTRRKLDQAKIEASLAEKEVLLREIHHRVKNNLQVISSLLFLQARQIDDEGVLDIFRDSQGRIRAMANIHERLYQSTDIARIDFGEYIRDLVNDVYASYKTSAARIAPRIDVGGVSLGIDSAVPCALVINELVSNALKHAFPEGREGEIGGEIGITLHRTDADEIELTISDNGVGLPEGFDVHRSDSLGLRLVRNLVENQLQGTIAVDGSEGTRFVMRFREIHYKRRM